MTTENRRTEVKVVLDAVCAQLNLTEQQLLAPGREEPRVTWRQMAMALARELTPATFYEIRDVFRLSDHNTIAHAMKAVAAKAQTDSGVDVLFMAMKDAARAKLEEGRIARVKEALR